MSADRNDRAAGAVLGSACGDALGAGYEFGPALPDGTAVVMAGGGAFGWAPGEWTDDTAMAVPILQAAAAGESLTHEATHDELVARWAGWSRGATDVGAQTAQVLRGLTELTARSARTAAKAVHERAGRTGGNGSLMRTAPVALRFVHDATDAGLVRAARAISGLTHFDADAADACVLWCAAIRLAIRAGRLDVRDGLRLLPEDRRDRWAARIDEAEGMRPADFTQNGWVVQAFQAAWCAIATTPVPEAMPGRHLRLALEAAVRGGGDTDTVAAIAGGLLGARWGASAVPAEWRRILHGWPDLDANALSRLAVLAVNGGLGDGTGWPAVDRVRPSGDRTLVAHPHDDGVLLGSLRALDDLPADVDAVVSLCRTGRRQTDRAQLQLWLIDQDGRNPNLDLVLRDAADAIAALRADGLRVLVHCAEGRSRTPAVGALYAALHRGVPAAQALQEVTAALPAGAPQRFLQEAVLRIAAAKEPAEAPLAGLQEPAQEQEQPGAPAPKPVLYVDLDNTLVDFVSGIERLPARARQEYGPSAAHPHGHYDDAPGIFALMEPMPGAIEAFHALAQHYDAYILSTAPWHNPSAWQHKLEWVHLHFGRDAEQDGRPNPAYKRLILSHRKDLNRGALLIDDRRANGAGDFEGELLLFGGDDFPDWAAVVAHLLPEDARPVPPGPARPRALAPREARGARRSAASVRAPRPPR